MLLPANLAAAARPAALPHGGRARSRRGCGAPFRTTARSVRVNAAARPGGGVLDKPGLEQAPVKQKSKTVRSARQQCPPVSASASCVGDTPPCCLPCAQLSPRYRLLLHNDNVNKREYVVRVLLKVVDGLTMDQAYDIMQEADAHGLALVIVTTQEQAEEYCNALRANGLVATVEPDSGPSTSKGE